MLSEINLVELFFEKKGRSTNGYLYIIPKPYKSGYKWFNEVVKYIIIMYKFGVASHFPHF